MKKLNLIGKIFLTIIFVLPFLLHLYSVVIGKMYIFILVPLFFISFSLYCIWFDKKKEKESKIKGFILTLLQFITCFVWVSDVIVSGFFLLAKEKFIID